MFIDGGVYFALTTIPCTLYACDTSNVAVATSSPDIQSQHFRIFSGIFLFLVAFCIVDIRKYHFGRSTRILHLMCLNCENRMPKLLATRILYADKMISENELIESFDEDGTWAFSMNRKTFATKYANGAKFKRINSDVISIKTYLLSKFHRFMRFLLHTHISHTLEKVQRRSMLRYENVSSLVTHHSTVFVIWFKFRTSQLACYWLSNITSIENVYIRFHIVNIFKCGEKKHFVFELLIRRWSTKLKSIPAFRSN